MRCFLAVDIPQPQKGLLAEGLQKLQRLLPKARWVRPEGLHITLKFLGEQGEAAADELLLRLSHLLAAGPAQVQVVLQGGGFFPHPQRPRVAWVGGQAPGLELWAKAAEEAAESLGVERESRPFSLHVTLARLERPWPPSACELFLRQVASWQLAPFTASQVVLYESVLTPQGAVYRKRGEVNAGKA